MVEAVNAVVAEDGLFEHAELFTRHAVTVKSQHGFFTRAILVIMYRTETLYLQEAHMGAKLMVIEQVR